MKPIFKALLASLWQAKLKLVLCVLAVGLSSWGISNMSYVYLMSDRDFHENFEVTEPAHFSMRIRNATPELLTKLQADADISGIERREMVTGRIRNSNGVWMPMQLFGVSNWEQLRMDKFKLNEAKVPAPKSIVVERNANDFLDIGADSLWVKLPLSDTLRLVRGGLAYDARLAPARMEGLVYAYTSLDSLQSYLPKNTTRWLFQVKAAEPDSQLLVRTAGRLRALAEQHGASVNDLEIPPPGKHQHQAVIEGIDFLLKSFGYVTIVLGVSLLLLILLTWLYPQIIHIGIMKAIGASTTHILAAYTAVLVCIIALGMAWGLPLGYRTALLFDNFISRIQNFEQITSPFPITVHLGVIAICMLLPMVFLARPVLHVARTTVHDAINTTFYTPFVRVFNLTQVLLGNLRLKYSINNLFRNTGRTSLILILIFIGMTLFTTGMLLRYSINRNLAQYVDANAYHLFAGFSATQHRDILALDSLPGIGKRSLVLRKGVEMRLPNSSVVKNTTLSLHNKNHVIKPELLLKGRLQPGCADCVVMNQRMAAQLATLGNPDSVVLTDRKGVMHKFGITGTITDLFGMPAFYAYGVDTLHAYNRLHIEVDAGADAAQVADLVEGLAERKGLPLTEVNVLQHNVTSLDNHLAPTKLILQGTGLSTMLIGIIGILIVLSLTMQERAAEIGIMKAVGAANAQISALFILEYLALSLLALLLGLLAGIGLNDYLCAMIGNNMLRMPFTPYFNGTFVFAIMTSTLLIQTLAIYLFCKRALRKQVQLLVT